MTVLSADRETVRKEAGLKSYLMGTDIVYKGGIVGITPAGLVMAMSATPGYTMGGIAYEKVDDSAAAGTKRVRAYTEGLFLLVATSITQAMVGQPMYAVDDQTFDDEPGVEAIFVGILVEYVSATSGWIDIGPACMGERVTRRKPVITKTANYTVLEEESGAVIVCNLDELVITLPPTKKGLIYTFVNPGADGAMLLSIDPDDADKILGNDLTGGDGGILSNTKSTAKIGDMVTLVGDGSVGWYIVAQFGVWAIA